MPVDQPTPVRARPRLAVTLGDPRGIGPEVVSAAMRDPRVQEAADLVIVGPSAHETGLVADESIGDWEPGGGPAAAGALAGRAIERAVALASGGGVEGIVTA
ncbi:MAG TPA: hypothetical protein VFO66_00795, partial [Gemmatimonadaceae bacterium]|nr:hypothetical protein [Gemmatimonadaceae bacterium]